ncbi:MAG: hypothetical protein HZB20_10475 [Chloroflexi bacterium]|nr:hypothetical protein [Chloroflexota bacterium]
MGYPNTGKPPLFSKNGRNCGLTEWQLSAKYSAPEAACCGCKQVGEPP